MRLRRSQVASDERGFTIVEVMIAASMLALVVGGAVLMLSSASSNSLGSQRQSAMLSVADQQIESIRQQLKTNPNGFGALAMSASPAAGSNSTLPSSSTIHTDPNDFVCAANTACPAISSVSGCPATAGYLIAANYDNTAEGVASGVASLPGSNCPAGVEPLVVQAGGIVNPVQTNVPIGTGSSLAFGTVYTYVTNTYLGCYQQPPLGSCSSATGDARRVVVAVVLNNGGSHNVGSGAHYDIGQNSPMYLSSIFTNPVPSNQTNSAIGLTLGAQIG